ncbi:MAG: HEAT repeat domain-containing protein [Planctomycetes bacterium]|nr:HEAT repeat domain-containing protein [Planctomycetota bacterium]MCC7169365.1 HEAT repeat domain-containing protein [Planctomycetota bacterium]
MVKRIATWMAAGVLFALAPEGFSHGGQYRGPPDTVPPVDGPGPNTGGPNTGGPNTGKPGGPVTPGGRGPTTPGGGPVTGGGGPPRGGVQTGGRKPRGAEDVGGWTFWWEINKDPYLDLRHALARQRASTGSTGILTGIGRSVRGVATNRPSDEMIASQIAPALRAALKANDAEIVDAAALSLGRILDAKQGEAVLDDLRATLKSPFATACQASVLSMGLLQRREAIPDLVEILRDSDTGRKSTDGGSVDTVTRGFAAIALGMIGDAASVPVLIDVAKTTDDSQRDVRSSAISALGLFEDDRDAIVIALTELLRDESMVADIRGTIPIALSRLGSAAEPAVPQLLKLASGKRTALEVAQSCLIALGRIASPVDAEVVKFLQKTITDSNDTHMRHFALMALADLGVKAARTAEEPGTKPVLADLCKALLQHFREPEHQVDQPWGAIALGIVARELPDHDEARATMARVVREKFEAENDPLRRAACAIGLGLMRSNHDGEAMLDALKDNPPAQLRGYLAVALGMVDYQPAADFLRAQVLVERDEKARMQLATGLGLLGDTRAVPELVEALEASTTLTETVSYSRAIGLIGDASAVPALVGLVNDAKRAGVARGFACVALGLLAEKSEMYWNTPLSVDANYRLAIRAQQEILDIL